MPIDAVLSTACYIAECVFVGTRFISLTMSWINAWQRNSEEKESYQINLARLGTSSKGNWVMRMDEPLPRNC